MAETPELVLWVKSECSACERARELMASLSAAMQFEWSTDEGEYGDSVPVVATADGQVLAEAPIVASELVDAILALNPPD
ncbi:MAG: hypothetical protein F4Y69_11000 [Chloroflexi bacterium]|nr:hypothetical protein [Chloroflexota bacterium]MXX81537.1 hypothetical protein [Chloroflexota bacterium]MYB23234.1 hypothetical protein [Chloroflexota bacterium]MYD16314.1 hypothetical protein [Chloroflexota bacterium]MYF21555.1 hypothetical protein [Chloroflexota bacterium]